MAAQQVQVEVRELKAGMFVSKLDCPWHKTPFPVQGFYIQGEEDLLRVQRHCRHVFVDVEKAKVKFSYAAHAVLSLSPTAASEKDMRVVQVKHHGEENLKLAPIVIKSPVNYATATRILKAVGKVEKMHKQMY